MRNYPGVEFLGDNKYKVFGSVKDKKPKLMLTTYSYALLIIFISFNLFDNFGDGKYEALETAIRLSLIHI